MTLGDGIFWGALLLAIVGLYLGTKDRWRWKRILLLLGGGVLTLGLLGAGGVAGYNWNKARPRVLTEYWGVALGMLRADVLILKGEPSRRLDDSVWMYGEGSFNVQVEFKDDRVSGVFTLGDRVYWPTLGNVSPYESMQDLIERFGSPTWSRTSSDGLHRTMTFDEYNLVVSYSKGGMVVAGIEADSGKGRVYAPNAPSGDGAK